MRRATANTSRRSAAKNGMPNQHHDTSAFERLAEHYADEMSAQFRTLSLFVRHAGEVGRSHEVFLAQVLARFLPQKLRIGTGFVYSPRGATRQQDIIIYEWQVLPLPLQIGDCVVVETKSSGAPTPLDRALWARGSRPQRVSKFAVAMALSEPGLPANRWNRVLREHLDWQRSES